MSQREGVPAPCLGARLLRGYGNRCLSLTWHLKRTPSDIRFNPRVCCQLLSTTSSQSQTRINETNDHERPLPVYYYQSGMHVFWTAGEYRGKPHADMWRTCKLSKHKLNSYSQLIFADSATCVFKTAVQGQGRLQAFYKKIKITTQFLHKILSQSNSNHLQPIGLN